MQLKLLDTRIDRLEYATAGSAACDLRACTLDPTGTPTVLSRAINLYPGAKVKIGAGFAMHLDPMRCALILPRSGLGSRGIVLSNVVGLIDGDYQGEVIMAIENRGDDVFVIEPLARIAQMMIVKFEHPDISFVEEFTHTTERGAGGYGSTGST